MLMKAIFFVAALAAPALAYEPVTCTTKPAGGQFIVTSITPNEGFCTMLTGKGVDPVAPNEGCASVYCYGPASKLGPPTPAGYILSANYAVTANYTQVTGCIDSAVWGQNPQDQGGQMDSHGWPYSCKGFTKFLSLLEPASNTYCLRCCNGANIDTDCDTSHSTRGCWNLVPGQYQMADGSACKPPVGAPVASGAPTAISGALPTATGGAPGGAVPTGSGTAPGVAPPNGGSTGGNGGNGGNSGSTNNPTSKTSAGGRASSSFEVLSAAAVVAMAVVAAL